MMTKHTGSCHCGAVKIEFEAPAEVTVHECNCSICSMVGYLHLIVPSSRFKLLQGQDFLVEYRFNTKVARHFFCNVCGVKPFYVPRSNPDGYSVNMRCVDKDSFDTITIEPFNGQSWEQHAGALAHLSKDG